MSKWLTINDSDDVELSEDGRYVEILYATDDAGNCYIEVPVIFITRLLRQDAPQAEA